MTLVGLAAACCFVSASQAQTQALLENPIEMSYDALSGQVIFTLTNFTAVGFAFSDLSTPNGGFIGTLTSVAVNATLTASTAATFANDLTIYVAPGLVTGGLLQVGGFSSLSAVERRSWTNGNSGTVGTVVNSTITLNTPLSFTGTAADQLILLGNGYGAAGTSGTWTGTVTLNFASAVPEPSSWALFAAGAVGMAGFVARRRKAQNAAA
jgi:hypothetical protein